MTAVEPTEKEKEPVTTENEDQVTEPSGVATEPTTTHPTEETTTTATSTVEENSTSPIEETVSSTTPQLTEKETTETEPHKDEPKAETEPSKVTEPEPTKKPVPFDIDHWIACAMSCAESKGLVLSDTRLTAGTTPSEQAHTAFTSKEISKADLIVTQGTRTSPTCGFGQKLQATTATTFISATLKSKIILSLKHSLDTEIKRTKRKSNRII